MIHELLYTSAPRGLKPGNAGFCTVARTRGLPTALAERLEWLSGYRPLYPAGDAKAKENPVSFAHWRVPLGPQTVSVLSRVCFAGLDYTQRSNKFAHHLVLDADDRPAAGPAWVLRQPNVMETAWRGGEPTDLPPGRSLPAGDAAPAACTAWAAACGDAGWAGALVEAYVTEPAKPAYLIYSTGTDVLELFAEALAPVPEGRRWQVTFNTYFTDLPAGLACAWRCCVAGTPAAKEAARAAAASGSFLIDLTSRAGTPPDSPYVRFARSGAFEDTPAPAEVRGSAIEAEQAGPRASLLPQTAVASPGDPSVDPVMPRPPIDSPEWLELAVQQGPARDGGRRRIVRARWPFWVASILWPLAVATVAWNSLKRPHPTSATPATTTKPDDSARANEIATLRRQVADLTARLELEKAEAFDKGKAAGSMQPPDPRLWVRREDLPGTQPAAHTDADYAALAIQIEQLKWQLAHTKTVATAPLITPGHAIGDDGGRVLAQWVSLSEITPGAGAPVMLAVWPGSKPAKATLVVPGIPASVYKQKAAADGGTVLYRSSGSGLNGDLERARLFLTGDKLMIQWLTDAGDEKELKAIQSYLMFAAIRVNDEAGNSLGVVQFVEPERCNLFLREHRALFKKTMPPPQAGAVRLIPLASPAGYSVVEGGGAGPSMAFKARSGGSFNIDADASGVSTNWPDVYADALVQKSLLETTVDRWRLSLPKTKKNEIDNAKRTDDKLKSAFAAYDLAVEQLRLQEAVCTDLARPFRATFALCLPNGVVLATTEVSKERVKPE